DPAPNGPGGIDRESDGPGQQRPVAGGQPAPVISRQGGASDGEDRDRAKGQSPGRDHGCRVTADQRLVDDAVGSEEEGGRNVEQVSGQTAAGDRADEDRNPEEGDDQAGRPPAADRLDPEQPEKDDREDRRRRDQQSVVEGGREVDPRQRGGDVEGGAE